MMTEAEAIAHDIRFHVAWLSSALGLAYAAGLHVYIRDGNNALDELSELEVIAISREELL